ncbi:MAG: DUF559 domain-containing protein [Archangium sp.]
MNIEKSRDLRREATNEEKRLWSFLRTRPLGFKFRRQHPIDRWIADLACPEARLIIELDGSGHAEPGVIARDRRRTVWLENHAWVVLRFWNFEIWSEWEAVLQTIFNALTAPHPGPLPASQGEGER